VKRVLTIQDISCTGRCSLTVALPVLSAMGVECAVLPTAVLSTHTAYSGFTFRDLTDDLLPVARHWAEEGFSFDLILVGYLGSARQIEIVRQVIGMLKQPGTEVLIDPVMGDNGRLYSGFTPDFVREMAAFAGEADCLIPNATEACFLLGREYAPPADEAGAGELASALLCLGPKNVCLTGTPMGDRLGCVIRGGAGEYSASAPQVPASYHGTGDLFAAAFAGARAIGRDYGEAAAVAAEFTSRAIALTLESGDDPRRGVRFEAALPHLMKLIYG